MDSGQAAQQPHTCYCFCFDFKNAFERGKMLKITLVNSNQPVI